MNEIDSLLGLPSLTGTKLTGKLDIEPPIRRSEVKDWEVQYTAFKQEDGTKRPFRLDMRPQKVEIPDGYQTLYEARHLITTNILPDGWTKEMLAWGISNRHRRV